jgi:hypothetical protein
LPTQKPDTRFLKVQAMSDRDFLSMLQIGEGIVEVVSDAFNLRTSNPGTTPLGVVAGR